MRLSHPYVWVLLIVLGVLGTLLIAVVAAINAVRQAWRRRRWPRERERRRSWKTVLAHVESARRVTERGDFILVIVVAADRPRVGYRDDPGRLRWRKLLRLPKPVSDWIEDATTLPVLVDPNAPATLAIDFETLIARGDLGQSEGDADALARGVYAEQGQWTWAPLPSSSSS